MRANNLLLIWLGLWLACSIVFGWGAYNYLGFETIPAVVSLMAIAVLKLLEGRLENAVFAERLRASLNELSESVLPNDLARPVKIKSLAQYTDVTKFFRIAVYIDDAISLIARIKRDISYYFLGGLLTMVPVLFSVVDKKSKGIAANLFELNWILLVPIIGVLLTIFRFWTPIQDMATRNEPIVRD